MKRSFSRFLSAALILSLLVVPTFAAQQDDPASDSAALQTEDSTPDPEGTVSWSNLRQRIRNGNNTLLSVLESIQSIEVIDYDQWQENLRDQLNSLANAQWGLSLSGGNSSSLDSAYDSLRDTLDDLQDGEIQADNEDAVWQLESTVNQLIQAGENQYISILSAEQSLADAQRNLEALDRSLEEARLRQSLGKTSQQSVEELEQSRAETVSQINSLNTTIKSSKAQLQILIGEAPDGEITLTGLPSEEESEWTQPDYEADLAAAKQASWTIREAEITLADAKEEWSDVRGEYLYRGNSGKYMVEQADHTWNSAQLTYQSALQEFELSFQQAYESLSDYEQVYQSKKSALSYQENQLQIAQKKYELGQLSYYDVLTAQDNVDAARSAVESAWLDLFSARNNYSWAVECGLL